MTSRQNLRKSAIDNSYQVNCKMQKTQKKANVPRVTYRNDLSREGDVFSQYELYNSREDLTKETKKALRDYIEVRLDFLSRRMERIHKEVHQLQEQHKRRRYMDETRLNSAIKQIDAILDCRIKT